MISQREARRMRKELAALRHLIDQQRDAWSAEYVGGTHIRTVAVDNASVVAVQTARKLRHAVVATIEGSSLRLYALPHKGER